MCIRDRHNTGAGKVLTAYSAAEVREKIISHCSFASYSERTITDKDEYRQVLDTVRRNGYATNEGESEPYLKCITYPIFGYGGKIEAALSLSGIIQYLSLIHISICRGISWSTPGLSWMRSMTG